MKTHVQPGSTSTTVDPAERAREIALRVLTAAPKSAAQLREALVSREVEPHVADAVIERYREVGLLDDASLAAMIVRTRHSERGQSRRAIRVELQRKGFATHDIESALTEVSDQDEQEAALALAAKKWASLREADPHVRQRRILGFLGRKGYSPSFAIEVMKRLESADIWEDRTHDNT